MSDSAPLHDAAIALDALKSLSAALRHQHTPRLAASALVRQLREGVQAPHAVLAWSQAVFGGASRSGVVMDPPASFATADWEPVRLLIARGLLTAEVSTWGETAEEDVRAALRSLGMSSCTAVPLDVGGRRRGVLLLLDASADFVSHMRWIIDAFAPVLALSAPSLLSAAEYHGDAAASSAETDQMRRIERALAAAVGEVHDLQEGLRLCLEAAIAVGGLDSGGFYLVDEVTGALSCVTHIGLSPEFVKSVSRFEADSLHARVVMAGEPLYMEFVRPGHHQPEAEAREGLRVLCVVPLRHAGRVIGCLNVASHRVDEVSNAHRHALESIAAEAGHAIARLRGEIALRESEARAQALLSAIPDLLFRMTRDGVFIDFRADVRDLYVQDPTLIIGRSFRDVLPPDVAALVAMHLDDALETGTVQTFEYQLPMPDRGTATYEGRLIASGANEVTVVVRDITEATRAEQEQRANQARFRHLIESANDWIWEATADGTLTYCSPHCATIVGFSPDELLGRNIFEFLSPDEHRRATAFHDALGQTPASFRGYEWSITGKDGQAVILESNGVPVVSDDGTLIGFRGVNRDITARRREEEENQRLQSELAQAQKMESVGRLAGGVAHDFNNMLQAILGNVALAMRGLSRDNPVRERLVEIQACAERSADLTRQLLAFARKQTASPRLVDLNRAVEGMLKMLRRLIGENIQLAWLPGDRLGQVRIDPSQVDQVLANLCVNARDAISGSGLVTIATTEALLDAAAAAEIPEATPGSYLRLSVSDNGSGMSPEVMSRAFEPFFTTKELGRGTGLGLSTVYGIVRQNGGFVHLQSTLNVGTRVEVYLPLVAGYQHAPGAESASADMLRGRETVLLVEDELAILVVAQSMLESLGYSVLTASTPRDAIDIVTSHPQDIDLLVTDVVMPEMNGLELARRLTAIKPSMKKLFTSGYTSDVMAQHGLVETGIRFIQKPFNLDDIAHKVREALDESGQDVVLA